MKHISVPFTLWTLATFPHCDIDKLFVDVNWSSYNPQVIAGDIFSVSVYCVYTLGHKVYLGLFFFFFFTSLKKEEDDDT